MDEKRLAFPSAFTVLFILLIFVAILTYIVPSGAYSKLKYEADKQSFSIIRTDGSIESLQATQETLNSLKVKISIEKFKDGSISKPIAIPNTYEKVPKNPQGGINILKAPIEGIYDTIDIIAFVLIIGGVIGILNSTGTFYAGIASLSKVTKGKEFLLIVFLTILIVLGGTTFGLAEETIVLYPVLIPVFMVAGYDVIVCLGVIYIGSNIGRMFGTINPFSSVIASNAAGITFTHGLTMRTVSLILGCIITIIYILKYGKKIKKDPTQSLMYDQREKIKHKFLKNYDCNKTPKFNIRRKLMLSVFVFTFIILAWGVSSQCWEFKEMTALFLFAGIIIGVISGIGEKAFVNNFVAGASELVGVALIIGMARGINLIMTKGHISDTILNMSSDLVTDMNPKIFIIVMFIIFMVLGFFIPSSSGLAVLAIPIMAPLADSVGLSRDVIVSAYQYGQGLIGFIAPTGLAIVSLSIVDITYDRWLKFITPLMGYIGVLTVVMLLIQCMF